MRRGGMYHCPGVRRTCRMCGAKVHAAVDARGRWRWMHDDPAAPCPGAGPVPPAARERAASRLRPKPVVMADALTGEPARVWDSAVEAARALGRTPASVAEACRTRAWPVRGIRTGVMRYLGEFDPHEPYTGTFAPVVLAEAGGVRCWPTRGAAAQALGVPASGLAAACGGRLMFPRRMGDCPWPAGVPEAAR